MDINKITLLKLKLNIKNADGSKVKIGKFQANFITK